MELSVGFMHFLQDEQIVQTTHASLAWFNHMVSFKAEGSMWLARHAFYALLD